MKVFIEKHPGVFWYMNVFLPLICGMTLYMFIHQDWLFAFAERQSSLFCWLRSITYREFRPQSWFGYFVKNQLGDLLWAYAFEVTLVLSTGNLRKALLYGIVITIAAELFQLLPIVYATFDILDIIAQVVGIILASIVSRCFYKHWLTIETH